MRTPGLKPRLFGWSILAILFLGAPTFAQATSMQPEARECKPGPDDSLGKKKTDRSKRSKALADVPAASQVCLEIRTPALMIQERLQKYVRAQRWNIYPLPLSGSIWIDKQSGAITRL